MGLQKSSSTGGNTKRYSYMPSLGMMIERKKETEGLLKEAFAAVGYTPKDGFNKSKAAEAVKYLESKGIATGSALSGKFEGLSFRDIGIDKDGNPVKGKDGKQLVGKFFEVHLSEAGEDGEVSHMVLAYPISSLHGSANHGVNALQAAFQSVEKGAEVSINPFRSERKSKDGKPSGWQDSVIVRQKNAEGTFEVVPTKGKYVLTNGEAMKPTADRLMAADPDMDKESLRSAIGRAEARLILDAVKKLVEAKPYVYQRQEEGKEATQGAAAPSDERAPAPEDDAPVADLGMDDEIPF